MTETKLTPEEAREALELVEQATRQMRRALAYGGAPYFMLIWGVVWLLGFGATHFLQGQTTLIGWIWAVLDTLGFLATFAVGATLGSKIRSPLGARVGLAWLVWIVYGFLVVYFAHPQSQEQTSLLISLMVMMGYLTTAILYASPFLAALGVAMTVLIIVGYLAFFALFNLWMALLGGGTLIAGGLYILRAWR